MSKRPAARPQISQAELEAKIEALKINRKKYPLLVVGARGYYKDTMGKPGVNDRGDYDDALFVLAPGVFRAFNGNTDPSAEFRTGLASLVPGVYYAHRIDMHRGSYLALCQRTGEVVVHRDGTESYKAGTTHPEYGECLGNGRWKGWFGINIHRGGDGTTSSLGCQTLPPEQWDEFFALVKGKATMFFGSDWRSQTIPYILLDFAA